MARAHGLQLIGRTQPPLCVEHHVCSFATTSPGKEVFRNTPFTTVYTCMGVRVCVSPPSLGISVELLFRTWGGSPSLRLLSRDIARSVCLPVSLSLSLSFLRLSLRLRYRQDVSATRVHPPLLPSACVCVCLRVLLCPPLSLALCVRWLLFPSPEKASRGRDWDHRQPQLLDVSLALIRKRELLRFWALMPVRA